METKTIQNLKKAGALAGIAVLAGAGGAVAGAQLFPTTVTETEVVTETEIVEVEKEVEVIREVTKDNEEYQLLLDGIVELEGDLTNVFDGLKDSEVEQIVDRIAFYFEAQAMAEEEVKHNAKYELHNVDVNGEVLDRRDIVNLRIDDSSVSVDSFDNEDANVNVDVVFTHDSIRYTAEFEVKLLDGQVTDLSLVQVN